MVAVIEKNYDNFDGFVILHGTDTMVYTASALSFMIRDTNKPIIITGSQLPILDNSLGDGEHNFKASLRIAAQYPNLPAIPEVCIYFRDHLYRGNRCRKVNATGFRGFESPNYSNIS